MLRTKEILENIKEGTEEILPLGELYERMSSGSRLRIKLGFDPTSPHIHLGHTLALRKLREFQKLNHEIVLIVGDFTATIGDPTGKSKTRFPITYEEVRENIKTYKQQISKIVDTDRIKILFNSSWINKLSPYDFIQIASKQTVARMLEREDFKNRLTNNKPVSTHEFLYPLLQAYDSLVINSDIEIGGSDQKFNLLAGRELQKKFGKKTQSIITVPIIEGIDGIKKMSKTEKNYIGVNDSPEIMFRKIMSISDNLMWKYWKFLTNKPEKEIEAMKLHLKSGRCLKDAKTALAKSIVSTFHSLREANFACNTFCDLYSAEKIPEDINIVSIESTEKKIWIAQILKKLGLTYSTSEAIRLIKQKAVYIDGVRIEDADLKIISGSSHIYQVGKRRFIKANFNCKFL